MSRIANFNLLGSLVRYAVLAAAAWSRVEEGTSILGTFAGVTQLMIGWPQSGAVSDALRQLVRGRLAELGHLEIDAFPMTERVVVKRGKPCGVYFCMHGPRSVKLTAVIDLNAKKILFYGSDGQRAEQLDVPKRQKS
ncbi:hypothetical protein SH139x_004023 [Planctomycetaceae bacterium SH139]